MKHEGYEYLQTTSENEFKASITELFAQSRFPQGG